MKSVGIKVLKDKLSRYLDLVRGGEIVLVTDRDEVVAEIRKPSRAYTASISSFEAFLSDAAARGSVTAPTSATPFPRGLEDLPAPPPVAVDIAQMLDESREDRG
jgi:antitoxin (DNA-binding transcriptional repressor) of toxin-antitoxin stability system